MANIELLFSRKSHSRLVGPAPDKKEIEQLVKLALRAPDHALLKPWRYLVFAGESLKLLGEHFAKASLSANPDISNDKLERIKKKPFRAPMVIVSIVTIKQHKKVPELEQVLSAGAGVQNLIMAAHLQNIGAIWRTGDLAFNLELMRLLGLDENEKITGFVYLGQEEGDKGKVVHPDQGEFVRWI